MKRIVCMHVILLCVSQVHAMGNGDNRMKLQSNDGWVIDISEKEAHLFGTLKDMLIDTQKDENPGDESPVPVSMSGADLQAMVEDIPWIRKMHAAHNQSIDDIENIVQLDGKTRRERARKSVENIDQIPMYSDETLQAMIQGIKAASCLDFPESVEKNAKIISELLVSKKFLKKLHADPDNNSVRSLFSLPQELQNAIHSYSYMPQHWGEQLKIKHGNRVGSVAFSPNSEWLATISYDDNVRIIEVATGAVKHEIEHDGSVGAVTFSPSGQYLATRSNDKNSRIIEVATGVVKQTIKHGDWVKSVAFSPNGQYLATGSSDRNARIIEVATGDVEYTIKHDDWVNSVAFSPNGELLATGSWCGNVRLIEVATGVERHTIKHGNLVFSVAFSPNGQCLAAGSDAKLARLIEVMTGAVRHTIKHGSWVNSVAFSPNGEYLATGSDDNACIIEIATGDMQSIVHDDSVFSVAFSPNGQWFATGSGDKNVRIHACLTDNFKNAVLVSYLKSCQENKLQPNMRGWVSEAVQNHRYQKALKNAFPGLAIFGAEQSKWCAII